MPPGIISGMARCQICGIELVKPEDLSLGDTSKNLCAQCSKMRIHQTRFKPWQDTAVHKKFGSHAPPSENQVHEAYVEKLRLRGKSPKEIKELLKKWHRSQSP